MPKRNSLHIGAIINKERIFDITNSIGFVQKHANLSTYRYREDGIITHVTNYLVNQGRKEEIFITEESDV